MSQSTMLRDLPKDPMMQNPEEARLVQSIINENNPEMFNGGMGGMPQQGGGQGYGMQQGQNFVPNFDEQADMVPQMQNPSMPPGMMGGADPIMQQQAPQMPQMVPAMLPQQQMQQPQMAMQMPQQMMCGPNGCDLPQNFGAELGWTEWIWEESKETLIIAIVAFILSFRIIQNLIQNYVPYMQSGMLYMVFRSLLIGIFFYLIKKIWN